MRLKRRATLPLGVDLGSARVRIALSEQRNGTACLTAVAARDLPDEAVTPETIAHSELVSAVIEDAHRELGTAERRCVFSVGAEVASVRIVRFPPMSESERRRAARFEAERFASWDLGAFPSIVRAHPVSRHQPAYAVGTVRAAALTARIRCLTGAGLRAVAADYDSCAWRRAFPVHDAVLDVGFRRTVLHAFAPSGPIAVPVGSGGEDVTRAIAADLGIDRAAAEQRKRLLGNAGAGIVASESFVQAVRTALAKARERIPDLRRIAATGNGSRLANLLETIEPACGVRADLPLSDAFAGSDYPHDVLRAGAPDWTLAASLAAWGAGA